MKGHSWTKRKLDNGYNYYEFDEGTLNPPVEVFIVVIDLLFTKLIVFILDQSIEEGVSEVEKEKFVLRLQEQGVFSNSDLFLGYWTGKYYYAEDVCFPGYRQSKLDKDVKVYTSKKRAENAVAKLKGKYSFVKNAVIETL